ncbi:MAG: biotin--[acetyl-CoA-carboxylase] ligase [Bacteroidaceae bacterium]|nr:biotin--[acetyl-CoA-carboxylase] ligase [Bacteroidaceae bacterium]
MMKRNIDVHWLEVTDSTNNWLRMNPGLSEGVEMKVAATGYQTAGRGQQGNSWESEKDCNLLFSVLSKPSYIDAGDQFLLSQAISLAVLDAVTPLLGEKATYLTVKWPNDIYWKEMKLAGILIENKLLGTRLCESIAGVGLNVNQTLFRSNAPNPISIRNITGKDNELAPLLESVLEAYAENCDILRGNGAEGLRRRYEERLFRREGFHRFSDLNGDFKARIVSVKPNGIIVMEDESGSVREYEFKQVSYILDKHSN